MSPRWTKDERFIVCAYEAATRNGDIETVLNRYEIGQACGLSQKAVDAISKLLAQANFVKMVGKTEMRLTGNGEALAIRLLGEK